MTPRRTLGLCYVYIPQLKRNPWVMLCSHSPINNSSSYLNKTVYLAVMLQASWYAAEGT